MKKIKLNKKLFLNKDVVSNLNSKHLNALQGGTVQNCQPAIPDIHVFHPSRPSDFCTNPQEASCACTLGASCDPCGHTWVTCPETQRACPSGHDVCN